MNQEQNPYQSPIEASAGPGGPNLSVKRPASPMVFGILCLVFSSLGILGAIMKLFLQLAPQTIPGMEQQAEQQEAMLSSMGYSPTYMLIAQVIQYISLPLILAIGIGLVRYRHWGRKGFTYLAIVLLTWGVINSGYVVYNILGNSGGESALTAITLVSLVVGMLFSFLYYGLGIYFLNSTRVKEALK